MTGFNELDPLESPAESRQGYRIHELAEELDTSVEQVERWIREADIQPTSSSLVVQPTSDEEHASYHADTVERLRGPRRGGV